LADGQEDALALLRADHDKVEEIFTRFDEIKFGRSNAEKKRLVDEVCQELRVHAVVEETVFYPAVRAEIVDDDLMNEAKVEHEGALRLVEELEGMEPTDELLNAKMHVLCAYVRHHVREEEQDMFPKAREVGLDLVALAAQIKDRKRKLEGKSGAKTQGSARASKARGRAAPDPRATR
jgi:hemerythrin superfamily protein